MKRDGWDPNMPRFLLMFTKEAWTKGQIFVPEQDEYLKETNVVHCNLHELGMCLVVCVDHEWVSERTIVQHEEETLGLEMNHKIKVPCVVQWSPLRFSDPTELNYRSGT